MARPRRRGRAYRRAEVATELRYGSEFRGLDAMIDDIKRRLKTTVRAEKGTAESISAAVDEVVPQLAQVYAQANQRSERANADAAAGLAAAGGAGQPFAAVNAVEQADAARRRAEEESGAQRDLQTRKVQAAEGAQYAVRNAGAEARTDIGQVNKQRHELEGEAGLFAADQYEGFVDDAADLRLERGRLRVSEDNAAESRRHNRQVEGETQRHNRQTEKNGGDGPNGKKGPTAGQITKHQGIVASIQDARGTASQIKRRGKSWDQVKDILTGPTSLQNRDGETIKNPYGGHSSVVAQAAVELARDGRVSAGTMRALKARGLLPGKVKRWRPAPKTRSESGDDRVHNFA